MYPEPESVNDPGRFTASAVSGRKGYFFCEGWLMIYKAIARASAVSCHLTYAISNKKWTNICGTIETIYPTGWGLILILSIFSLNNFYFLNVLLLESFIISL